MQKRIIIGFLVIILLIVLSLVFLQKTAQAPTSEESVTLRAVFSSKECEKACWKGFEPFVSSRASVESWLNASRQSYSVGTTGRQNDTLLWNITEKNPLPEFPTENQARISMEFSEDNILWRIALTNVYICVDTIISAYGTPTIISADSTSLQMGYPNEGLMFGMSKSENAFTLVFMTSDKWVEYFTNAERQTWEAAQEALNSIECTDAFSIK